MRKAKQSTEARLPLAQYLEQCAHEYVLETVDEMRANSELDEVAVKNASAKVLRVSVATLYRLLKGARTVEAGGKVYLMRHRCGAYKIGFTTGAPKFREKTLQAEDPGVELVQWWFGSIADERALHALFEPKRQRGEWFTLDADDVATIQRVMRDRKK